MFVLELFCTVSKQVLLYCAVIKSLVLKALSIVKPTQVTSLKADYTSLQESEDVHGLDRPAFLE